MSNIQHHRIVGSNNSTTPRHRHHRDPIKNFSTPSPLLSSTSKQRTPDTATTTASSTPSSTATTPSSQQQPWDERITTTPVTTPNNNNNNNTKTKSTPLSARNEMSRGSLKSESFDWKSSRRERSSSSRRRNQDDDDNSDDDEIDDNNINGDNNRETRRLSRSRSNSSTHNNINRGRGSSVRSRDNNNNNSSNNNSSMPITRSSPAARDESLGGSSRVGRRRETDDRNNSNNNDDEQDRFRDLSELSMRSTTSYRSTRSSCYDDNDDDYDVVRREIHRIGNSSSGVSDLGDIASRRKVVLAAEDNSSDADAAADDDDKKDEIGHLRRHKRDNSLREIRNAMSGDGGNDLGDISRRRAAVGRDRDDDNIPVKQYKSDDRVTTRSNNKMAMSGGDSNNNNSSSMTDLGRPPIVKTNSMTQSSSNVRSPPPPHQAFSHVRGSSPSPIKKEMTSLNNQMRMKDTSSSSVTPTSSSHEEDCKSSSSSLPQSETKQQRLSSSDNRISSSSVPITTSHSTVSKSSSSSPQSLTASNPPTTPTIPIMKKSKPSSHNNIDNLIDNNISPVVPTKTPPPTTNANNNNNSSSSDSSSYWDLSGINSNDTPSRWTQFESSLDSKEHFAASARAIATAAEKAAMKDVNQSNPDRTGESVLVLTVNDSDDDDDEEEVLDFENSDSNSKSNNDNKAKALFSIDDDDDDDDERMKDPYTNRILKYETESEFTNLQKERLLSIIGSLDDDDDDDENKQQSSQQRQRSSLPGWLSNFGTSMSSSSSPANNNSRNKQQQQESKNKSSSNNTPQRSSSGKFDNPDAIRAEALRMLEMAETRTSFNSDESSSSTTTPRNKASSSSYLSSFSSSSRRKKNDDDHYDDEIILQHENDDEEDDTFEPESGAINNKNKKPSWSSRYSLDRHLPYSVTQTLANADDDDEDIELHPMSATRMSRSSPYSNDDRYTTTNTINVVERILKNEHITQHRPVVHRPTTKETAPFVDVSLGTPSPKKRSNNNMIDDIESYRDYNIMRRDAIEKEIRRRTRRRLCGVGCSVLVLALVVVLLQVVIFDDGFQNSNMGHNKDATTFYLLYSTPHSRTSAGILKNQVESTLSSDTTTDFILHLGDCTDPSVTLCTPTVYNDAAASIQSSIAKANSHVKMLALPGERDYLYCPDPHKSWDYWKQEFIPDENNNDENDNGNNDDGDNTIVVKRQPGKTENFAFWNKNVLFLGINIISSTFSVQQDNIDWILEFIVPNNNNDNDTTTNSSSTTTSSGNNMNKEQQNASSKYFRTPPKAIVIFGHVHPLEGKKAERAFFEKMVDIVTEFVPPDVRVLYIHAGEGDGGGKNWEEYYPFDTDMIAAVQVHKAGGDDGFPPIKVAIGYWEEEGWYKFE